MNNYFENLNQREQNLVFFGAIFLGLYLIYALIVSPLIDTRKTKENELLDKYNTLVWMREAKKNFKLDVKKSLSNHELLSSLASELKIGALNKFNYQLKQNANGDIELLFEKVPFNIFINWLFNFNKKFNINVKQLSIQKTDVQGVVKLSLVISI